MMICDGNGNELTTGVQDHEAEAMAQRIANDRGESVWLYEHEDDTAESGREFAPAPTAQQINIYRDNIWAGVGRLAGGQIDNCPAVLGDDQDASDETYEAIQDAIAEGVESVERPDGVYTWIVTAE